MALGLLLFGQPPAGKPVSRSKVCPNKVYELTNRFGNMSAFRKFRRALNRCPHQVLGRRGPYPCDHDFAPGRVGSTGGCPKAGGSPASSSSEFISSLVCFRYQSGGKGTR